MIRVDWNLFRSVWDFQIQKWPFGLSDFDVLSEKEHFLHMVTFLSLFCPSAANLFIVLSSDRHQSKALFRAAGVIFLQKSFPRRKLLILPMKGRNEQNFRFWLIVANGAFEMFWFCFSHRRPQTPLILRLRLNLKPKTKAPGSENPELTLSTSGKFLRTDFLLNTLKTFC